MKLKDYLAREELTASEFAARIGRAVSTVTRLVHGESAPEPQTMAKIVAATGGAVQPNDFFLTYATFDRPERIKVAANGASEIPEEDETRAQVYRLLALLLAAPPDSARLQALAQMQGDATPVGEAVTALAAKARALDAETVRDEYHNLFIGIGQGELVPYGSYYLTGFLHEKPLAALRGDMAQLGIAQADSVPESEDHIASLCEMMSGLITGAFGEPVALAQQRRFFDAHVGCWAPRFFANLEAAKSAALYVAVGTLGRLFMAIEEQAFDMAA